MRRLLLINAVLAASALLSPAFAHHSQAAFDRTLRTHVVGTIKGFGWENPHSWIDLTVVRSNGKIEDWKFEGGGASRLEKSGWSKAMMKVGDKVTVEYNPARAGLGEGMFTAITLANGKYYPVGVFVPGGYADVESKEISSPQ